MKINDFVTKAEIEKRKKIYGFENDKVPSFEFNWAISGPTGCGKTTVLLNAILEPLLQYDHVFIFTNNDKQEKYEYLKNLKMKNKKTGKDVITFKSTEEIANGISQFDSIPGVKLIVFDDIMGVNICHFEGYFSESRHHNAYCIILVQSIIKLSIALRNNICYFILFKPRTKERQRLIADSLGFPVTLFAKLTEPNDFLCVDKYVDKIYKNFDEDI